MIQIIKKLRADRGGMVQHAEQAEFVYDTLNQYVDENSTVDPTEGAVLADAVKRAMNQPDPRKMDTHESQTASRKSPLATKNLLEDTDGCGSPLLLLTCALLMTSSQSKASNTEEGDDATVPGWRLKQLEEKKTEAEMDIDIAIATAGALQFVCARVQ